MGFCRFVLSLYYQCRVKECPEIQSNQGNSNTGQTQCRSFWKTQKNYLMCLFTTTVATFKRSSEIDKSISHAVEHRNINF